uniref:Protein PIF-like n=1 Tax=Crassostrea virginica TaxID=6565 RepID=A0A8B8BZU7_CRAVI|nr:protein PIF-like [Crassostrea virginica]
MINPPWFLRILLVAVFYNKFNAAQLTTGITKEACSHPMDVVFVLDGSDSVTPVNFDKVKKFTADIVNQFDLGQAKVHVGVIEFSTFIGRVIQLGQVNNLDMLRFLISNISMSNDGTGTHKALKRMREMFRERGRPEVPRIGVVITDGLSVSPYLTKEEARLLHLDGIVTFAVGIEGDKTFQTELEYIASSAENVLRVVDFDALPLNLSYTLCSIAATAGTTTQPTSSIVPERIGESSGKNDGYVDADRHFQVHSTDCTKYVEVVPGVGGAVTFVKSCSFGLFWDEISLTCVNSTQANCFNDPCKRFSAGYTYSMNDLCSGFWTCLDRKSFPACYTLGYRFDPVQGCVSDQACVDACPPKDNTLIDPLQACRDELYLKFNKGQEGNINGYKDFSGQNIHVAQRDVVISDQGDGMVEMNGNSSCLNIWRFSNIEYRSLRISLKFHCPAIQRPGYTDKVPSSSLQLLL